MEGTLGRWRSWLVAGMERGMQGQVGGVEGWMKEQGKGGWVGGWKDGLEEKKGG